MVEKNSTELQSGASQKTPISPEFWMPCYVWPNAQIPFRLYYESDKCRIFIIENIQHNYLWMRKFRSGIKPTDHFFVVVGCYYHNALVEEAARALMVLGLPIAQFHILFNDERESSLFRKYGFDGAQVNQNCFLDERRFLCDRGSEKLFSTIYIARLVAFKRHFLCSSIENLALIAGDTHGAASNGYVPPFSYRNTRALSEDEVCEKINQSRSGLILSETEGACFASSEYLLCGIPVISTPSEGGRAVWYDDYNSLIVEATPGAVKEAVDYFNGNKRDPEIIRNAHIALSSVYRSNFIKLLAETLESSDDGLPSPTAYFKENYYHKHRTSIVPNFDLLFPG